MDRKKIRICVPCLVLAAGLTQSATVSYTTDANWSSKTVNDADIVIINNNATVVLDQDDTAATVRVNNSASPTKGTLMLNQNKTLTATVALQLGVGTGAGIVTQSAGSVVSPSIVINNSGTGDLSRYDLSGGSVSASTGVTVNNAGLLNISGGSMTASALTVNSGGTANLTGGTLNMNGTLTANGTVTVDGGTIARNISGVTTTIAGTDAVKMTSGSYALTGGGVADAILLNAALFEVSGGDVDLMGQIRVNTGSEFKVVGNAATIDTMRVNQSLLAGTFRFVFDEDGISTINAADTVNLAAASIVVDGSLFSGSAGTFDLFAGTALSGLADTNNITVSGFESFGGAYVTQDATSGLVQLTVIPEPATLGLFVVASGGLMILRRLNR
jgi:hypothetical protein